MAASTRQAVKKQLSRDVSKAPLQPERLHS